MLQKTSNLLHPSKNSAFRRFAGSTNKFPTVCQPAQNCEADYTVCSNANDSTCLMGWCSAGFYNDPLSDHSVCRGRKSVVISCLKDCVSRVPRVLYLTTNIECSQCPKGSYPERECSQTNDYNCVGEFSYVEHKIQKINIKQMLIKFVASYLYLQNAFLLQTAKHTTLFVKGNIYPLVNEDTVTLATIIWTRRRRAHAGSALNAMKRRL